MKNAFLNLLEKAGSKGITVKGAMKAMGHSSVNSVYSSIHRLKEHGHKVLRTGELLILKGSSKTAPGVTKTTAPTRKATKVQQILSILASAGSQGEDKDVISKAVGVTLKNLIFHMYTLRQKGCKIECLGGRYYLKNKIPASLQADVIAREAPSEGVSSTSTSKGCIEFPGVDIEAVRRLSPAEQESYLDLALKAAFYQKCASALLETNSQFLNIKKEVCGEVQD